MAYAQFFWEYNSFVEFYRLCLKKTNTNPTYSNAPNLISQICCRRDLTHSIILARFWNNRCRYSLLYPVEPKWCLAIWIRVYFDVAVIDWEHGLDVGFKSTCYTVMWLWLGLIGGTSSSVVTGGTLSRVCGFDDLGDQIGIVDLDMKLDHIDEWVKLNVSRSQSKLRWGT